MTDPTLAKTTLKALGEAIKQQRAAAEPAFKNLHAAAQAFRAAYPKTSTSTATAPR